MVMGGFIDLTGARFGRLAVLGRDGKRNGEAFWHCTCDCGEPVTVRGYSLRTGRTTSCGCRQREQAAEAMRVHGRKHSAEYGVWQRLKTRHAVCRGLTSFSVFAQTVGPRPSARHRIDLVDDRGGYWCGRCDDCIGREANLQWTVPAPAKRSTAVRQAPVRVMPQRVTDRVYTRRTEADSAVLGRCIACAGDYPVNRMRRVGDPLQSTYICKSCWEGC